jgi:hypothetical protein
MTTGQLYTFIGNKPPVFCFINGCETGRVGTWKDQYNIYGIAQAILQTGAYLLGSRWKLGDSAAAKFAGEFYACWLSKRQSLGEAVRNARLVCREGSAADDFGWASYVFYGDPRLHFRDTRPVAALPDRIPNSEGGLGSIELPVLADHDVTNSPRGAATRDLPRQVAAVCYDGGGAVPVTFAIVLNEERERWLLPKGNSKANDLAWEIAQKRALIEAGAQGTIDQAPFAQYTAFRGDRDTPVAIVDVFLLKVEGRRLPKQGWREPQFVSPEKAKEELGKGRHPVFAREFARIIDEAVLRINQLAAR